MRAHRLGGATFKRACRPPGQIPARVRGSNDNRAPHRPAQPHFHTQTWPEGHRQLPRKLVLDPIGGRNPQDQAVRRPSVSELGSFEIVPQLDFEQNLELLRKQGKLT